MNRLNAWLATSKRVANTVRHRIGRRGAFLAFLAVLDFAYGYALLSTSVRNLAGQPDFYLSLHTWGWVWTGVGVVCTSGIALRKDVPQFTIAASLKAVWGGLYAAAWLTQSVPKLWISVVVWWAFALTVLLIAGWPEPRNGWYAGKETQ